MDRETDYSHLKNSEITKRIIGSAFEVHGALGPGFPEAIYRKGLITEFEKISLAFEAEATVPILYRGKKVGSRRVDFVIEKVVVVEIKAVSKLEGVHLSQAINYLKTTGLEVGLLLNFGGPSVEIRRVVNSPTDESPSPPSHQSTHSPQFP